LHSKEGATEEQLGVFHKASALDFLENKKLESECKFTWRSLLSGHQDYLKYVKYVHIPLEIPPPQVGLGFALLYSQNAWVKCEYTAVVKGFKANLYSGG
jgi:hypothetical protein